MTRLDAIAAAAALYMPRAHALVFARSVEAAVQLGEPLCAATLDVIRAWSVPRTGDAFLWPADVSAIEATKVICRAAGCVLAAA